MWACQCGCCLLTLFVDVDCLCMPVLLSLLVLGCWDMPLAAADVCDVMCMDGPIIFGYTSDWLSAFELFGIFWLCWGDSWWKDGGFGFFCCGV